MNSVGIREIQLRELRTKAAKAEASAAQPAAETAKQESVMSKPALKLVKARGAAKAATNRARRTKTTARAPSNVTTVRPGSKAAAIVDLLRRPEGCTTADVLKATGWPAVSMPQQAKAAGLKLRSEKEGRVTRYWAE
jgi:hypothetical protein